MCQRKTLKMIQERIKEIHSPFTACSAAATAELGWSRHVARKHSVDVGSSGRRREFTLILRTLLQFYPWAKRAEVQRCEQIVHSFCCARHPRKQQQCQNPSDKNWLLETEVLGCPRPQNEKHFVWNAGSHLLFPLCELSESAAQGSSQQLELFRGRENPCILGS